MALPNTHHGAEKLSRLLSGKRKLFFDGIGGVSMNSLAHISHLRGNEVSGYDKVRSEITEHLESLGIKVYTEADISHVKDADAVIYTVAMPEDSAEYAYAKENGITLISRADYLGYLMTGYEKRIGVSGTHGKSTTTGMIAHILYRAGVDPTVLNGAKMQESGSCDMIGGHEYFIFEACEYMDSFLDFNPTLAVVLNIELDHVDYFKSIGQMKESFVSFMMLTGESGSAVVNLDDENCRDVLSSYSGKAITFGRVNEKADYSSANEGEVGGYPSFDIIHGGMTEAHVTLRLSGEHNISDSLAAYAACAEYGIEPAVIADALSEYTGISRRMEHLGTTKEGALLYTDYAHHPTEIASTVAGARRICKGKLKIVFQPHTFSRTAELFDDFVSVFSKCEADEIILCDIYPARETNIYGVSSAGLAEKIAESGKRAYAAVSFESAAEALLCDSSDGDMLIVMGAGDVTKVSDVILSKIGR